MGNGFKGFGLDPLILKAIDQMGFVDPTPVQEETLPLLLDGKDVIAQAQTGTGKTAAFGFPLLQRLTRGRKPYALDPGPYQGAGRSGRGGAQEPGVFHGRCARPSGLRGRSIDEQISQLKRGVDIVVGTPGRLIDHMQRRTLDLSEIEYLVLDEADRMLDMGFIEDIEYILAKIPKNRQTMLFSATIPEGVREIAEEHMNDPIKITVNEEDLVLPTTRQIYFNIERKNKIWALCRVLDKYQPKAIVFAQTKMMVDIIEKRLLSYGYPVAAIHGDLTQSRREKVLKDFRSGKIMILIATDVAARGLDIEGVTHVINYDIPEDPEVYVHRIGRTGRAGKEGMAITFITATEMYLLRKIKEYGVVDVEEEQVPETGQEGHRPDASATTPTWRTYSAWCACASMWARGDGLRKVDLMDFLSNQLRLGDMDIGSILIEKRSLHLRGP